MDTKTFENLNLFFKDYEELNLRLVKYKKNETNMNDEFSQKCRGLILEQPSNKIICMPPMKSMDLNKFFSTYNFEGCTIEEFIDGTMINLWYYNGDWHISTRSSIGAKCRWYSRRHFSELFAESNQLDFNKLNQTYFYSFVLQHPENRIVTCYTEPKVSLVFVGSVNENNEVESLNLEEIATELQISIPKKYDFLNMEELLSFIEKQNFEFQGLVIKNGIYRTKIRNPNYNYARQLRGNTKNMKYLYFDLIKQRNKSEYLTFYPEFRELFNSYNKEFVELTKSLHRSYIAYHVKKTTKDINDIEFPLRPHCFHLHGMYKSTNAPITFDRVMKYLNTLEPAQLVFCINYKYRKNNKTDEQSSNAEAEADAEADAEAEP